MKTVLIFIAAILPLSSSAIEAYIVAGQSNGWRMSQLAPGAQPGSGAKLHYFGMHCVSEPDTAPLVSLSSLNPKTMGFALARGLQARAQGRDIVFIQFCRCGAPVTGAKAKSWWPGEDPANGKTFDDGLFGNFERYLASVRAQVKEQLGEELEIEGLFWHQGESNAFQDHAEYEQAIRNVFWRLRKVTGVPDLPIVAGHIRDLGKEPAGINAILDRLANRDPQLLTVSLAGDLVYAPDREGKKDVHIATAGCHELGQRMVAGLGLLKDGDGEGGFTVYAPSRKSASLQRVDVRPAGSGVVLKARPPLPLGFQARTITAHPSKPVLYVSGGGNKAGQNAATVFLDAQGQIARHDLETLSHGYAYLSTDRSARFLLGCDYGSGCIDVFPLQAGMRPGPRVAGLDEGRKTAHCVLPSPDNRFVYIPYVKDNNALYQYAFDAKRGTLTALDPKNANPPQGTGPRHLAYHPTRPLLYFSEEQGLGVSIYRQADDGRLDFWKRVRAPGDDAPEQGVSSSDIVISPNGRFLFAGIRGHRHDYDFIARYRLLPDGDLEVLGLTPAEKIPWGLAVSPDGRYLVATGYQEGRLMVFAIGDDGALKPAGLLACDPSISDLVIR